jgi:hypothetical protein
MPKIAISKIYTNQQSSNITDSSYLRLQIKKPRQTHGTIVDVKSSTLVARWPEYMFIREENPHLINRLVR